MLVVHAGPHKTATTYVQNNLFKARRTLETRGWIYPIEGMDGMSAHHQIAHNSRKALAVGDPLREALSVVGHATRAAGQNVVLSAEGFCRWGPAKLKRLAGLFRGQSLDFVYTVRDPFDVFYSFWAEEVKQGHVGSFASRFAEHFNEPAESRLLNPLMDLGPLLKLDHVRLRVIPFHLLKIREIDIYTHFCETALGLSGLSPPDPVARNEALPIELTEFLRLITILRAKGHRHIGSSLRHRFMDVTGAEERGAIAATVKAQLGDQVKIVRLDGQSAAKKRIENLLKLRLEGLWTLPPGDESIYNTDKVEYRYYNEFDLWLNPVVRKMAEDMLARMPEQG